MKQDTNIDIKALKVDGGASKNNFLMKFQSDIISTSVQRAKIMETTALGVAFLAGLRVGIWKSLDELKRVWKKDVEYLPSMDENLKNEYVNKWLKAVHMCMGWDKK